jgi:hypothetical protein
MANNADLIWSMAQYQNNKRHIIASKLKSCRPQSSEQLADNTVSMLNSVTNRKGNAERRMPTTDLPGGLGTTTVESGIPLDVRNVKYVPERSKQEPNKYSRY